MADVYDDDGNLAIVTIYCYCPVCGRRFEAIDVDPKKNHLQCYCGNKGAIRVDKQEIWADWDHYTEESLKAG